MFGPIPEIVLGAGVAGVFAFTLLGMMWHILKSQQALITNHLSEGTRALQALTAAVERNTDAVNRR